jgi:hypothetical protein
MRLLNKKRGLMNSIRTDYTELRDGRVNRNEWESLLGRLDAVGDEIKRALGRATSIEEPGSGYRTARTSKVVVSGITLITDCGYRTGQGEGVICRVEEFDQLFPRDEE